MTGYFGFSISFARGADACSVEARDAGACGVAARDADAPEPVLSGPAWLEEQHEHI